MLEELKRQVIDLRYDVSVGKLAVDEQWKAVQQTDAYRMWEGSKVALQTIAQMLERAEGDLRKAAEDQYAVDKNKTPASGIAIKLFDVPVYDAENALTWCMMNAQYLVKKSLDVKEFEKALPPGAPIEIKQVPRCQLASKLE
jgi:hypothetical protein